MSGPAHPGTGTSLRTLLHLGPADGELNEQGSDERDCLQVLDTTAFRVVVGRALLRLMPASGSVRVRRTLIMRRERMRRRLVRHSGLMPYPALVSGGGQLRATMAVESVEERRERQAVNGHEQAELTQISAVVSAQHGKALLP